MKIILLFSAVVLLSSLAQVVYADALNPIEDKRVEVLFPPKDLPPSESVQTKDATPDTDVVVNHRREFVGHR